MKRTAGAVKLRATSHATEILARFRKLDIKPLGQVEDSFFAFILQRKASIPKKIQKPSKFETASPCALPCCPLFRHIACRCVQCLGLIGFPTRAQEQAAESLGKRESMLGEVIFKELQATSRLLLRTPVRKSSLALETLRSYRREHLSTAAGRKLA